MTQFVNTLYSSIALEGGIRNDPIRPIPHTFSSSIALEGGIKTDPIRPIPCCKQTTNMAESCTDFEIVPNKEAKSALWQHFGFVKEDVGENITIVIGIVIAFFASIVAPSVQLAKDILKFQCYDYLFKDSRQADIEIESTEDTPQKDEFIDTGEKDADAAGLSPFSVDVNSNSEYKSADMSVRTIRVREPDGFKKDLGNMVRQSENKTEVLQRGQNTSPSKIGNNKWRQDKSVGE